MSEHIPMIASLLASLAVGRLLAQPTIGRLRRRLAHTTSALRHDPLTDLRNRTGLAEAYRAQQRARQCIAFVLIDLDGFKNVNDTHGHTVGDQVLIVAADRIRGAAILCGGVAARLSGDEFTVILPAPADVDRVVELVLTLLAEPVAAHTRCGTTDAGTMVSLSVTGSAGIYETGPDDDLEVALRRADIAMYHAKRTGGGHVHYESGMHMPPAADRRGRRLRDRHDGEPVLP